MLYQTPDFSVTFEVRRRVNKRLPTLEQDQRELMERLTEEIITHIDEKEVDQAANFKFQRDMWKGKQPNHFGFNKEVNRLVRRVERVVVTTQPTNWDQNRINEFLGQLLPALRSICRTIDPIARCFEGLESRLHVAVLR